MIAIMSSTTKVVTLKEITVCIVRIFQTDLLVSDDL